MKVDQPLISCIIPVYNAEKYLRRCVDSVLKQDYPFIEIILIDDGSTDASPSLCDEYALIYSNVIVRHIPNGGASLARKLGIELSRGEYITFVDSDDYVAVNYVSVIYVALLKYNVKISSCRQQILYHSQAPQFPDNIDIQILVGEKLMKRFFFYEFWGLPASLYHKSLFTNVYFPKETLSEDYYIKCQIFIDNTQMGYVDAPLYVYEKHKGSLSNTKLSLTAFEEFENVYHVYELTNAKIPKYAPLALKNVIETSVKLLLMGNYSERKLYSDLYRPIKIFLRNHTFDIFRNRFLLANVKIIALILRFCPSISYVFNRL